MATPLNNVPNAASVAVVTVSYGSESVLGPFLDSLPIAASTPIQLVVADNKPSDSMNTIATMTASAGGEYLPLPSNRGYGHAINEAVRSLPPAVEWVVVSNPDVIMNPGSIDILLNAARSDPSIASVGPRILSSDGDVYPSARAVPSLRSGVGHALFANLWPNNPWTRGYRRETGAAELSRRDAGWLSGACLMVRRSVFDALRGFDDSYFMYFEDVDLGYRIGKLGFRNVYEPSASVVHTGAHSTRTESARMIQAHHDSAQKFLFKKYPGPLLWPVRATLQAGLAVRSRVEQRRASL
jgi:N-acetylglucosaminyl-diphospho-decaprenol L-rhamnosyltransferase